MKQRAEWPVLEWCYESHIHFRLSFSLSLSLEQYRLLIEIFLISFSSQNLNFKFVFSLLSEHACDSYFEGFYIPRRSNQFRYICKWAKVWFHLFVFIRPFFLSLRLRGRKKEFSCWYRLVRFKIFHKKCQEIILINNIQSNSIFRRERAIGHENNVQKPAVVLPVALSECNSRKIYWLFSYIVGHNNMPRGHEN